MPRTSALAPSIHLASLISLQAGYKVNVANEKVPSAGIELQAQLGLRQLNLSYATFSSRYLGLVPPARPGILLPGKPKQATPEPTPQKKSYKTDIHPG